MASGARLPYPDPGKLKVRWITPNTIMIDIIKLRRARQGQCMLGEPSASLCRHRPARCVPQENGGVWARGRSHARTGGAVLVGFQLGRVQQQQQQLDGFGFNC